MRLAAVFLGLALVLGALGMLARGRADVDVTQATMAGYPAAIYRSRGASPPLGTVVVAHGIAANKELMRPWGLALARRGFVAVLVDQPGHGDSQRRLPAGTDGPFSAPDLAAGLKQVVDALVQQGLARPGQIGLLGHSMGAATVAALARADDRAAATVAISGGVPRAGEAGPRNLLLIAAGRDLPGLEPAVAAIAAGGGAASRTLQVQGAAVPVYGDAAAGTARAGYVAGNRNHLTVIYDRAVQELGAAWLALALAGPGPTPAPARAPREWVWVLAGSLGALLAFAGAAGLLAPRHGREAGLRVARRPANTSAGLFITLLGVAAMAGALAAAWLDPFAWLHLLVADYLVTFFLVMAGVFVAARYLAPDEFAGAPAEHPGATLQSTFLGLGAAAVLLGALGPVIQAGLSDFRPGGVRIWLLLALLLALWLYFIQEEGLATGVARYASPAFARLTLVGSRAILLAVWLASGLLPGAGQLLVLMLPVAAVVLVVLEMCAGLLELQGHPPAALAAFKAGVAAFVMAAAFPLG